MKADKEVLLYYMMSLAAMSRETPVIDRLEHPIEGVVEKMRSKTKKHFVRRLVNKNHQA